RGDEPADLVVRGGRVLSVFTREWLETDVAVVDGFVAGLGDYEGAEELDASGRYVVPGFIDAHVHLESSKLMLDEFARLVLPLGTTTVVVDPHEIANVLGTDGVHWLLDACAELPLDVFVMASSCVPASGFESPRRPLTPGDLEGLLRRRRVIGLAEMMNFPGVVAGAPSELEKLGLAGAEHVDGHAPGVLRPALQAHAAAGTRSDLGSFRPATVLKDGHSAAELPAAEVPDWVRNTVHVAPLTSGDLRIPWEGGDARVIGVRPGQIVTDSLVMTPRVAEGAAFGDPD